MNTTDGTSQKIRLTERPPVACASCYGQYTDRRHVDFGSSTDGAVLAGPSNIAGDKGQSIDEVIICDECLTAAAGLIGLEDSAPLHAEVDELQRDGRRPRRAPGPHHRLRRDAGAGGPDARAPGGPDRRMIAEAILIGLLAALLVLQSLRYGETLRKLTESAREERENLLRMRVEHPSLQPLHTPVDREAVNKERERREQLRKQLSSVGTVKFGDER
jgi:hypothetical protein